MKNFDKKSALIFGIVMGVFFFVQNLLIRSNYSGKSFLQSLLIAFFTALIAGLIFGWFMGMFMKSKFVKRTTQIELLPGETIVFETSANHFMGAEAVGGKLYLTSDRLVFKSHGLNAQNHEQTIEFKNIMGAERYKTLGIVDNGLKILVNNGEEKFVVQQPEEWVKKLTDIANKLK